jgi:drug/metabolite transporter (DMT)-like permease
MDSGFLYAIGAAVTWGLVYAIDQRILNDVPPTTLLFVDALITLIIMIPFAIWRNDSLKALFAPGNNDLWLIIGADLLATLAGYLIYMGIQHLGASTASVIEIAYPFFVVLFTSLLFHATPNIYFICGAVLIFTGSAIITYFR